MASQSNEGAIGAGEKVGFPPFDAPHIESQLLWLALTFGAFYLLMARIVLPRIGSILETRSDRIAQDLDEAARLKQESDSAHEAYETELRDAKASAHAIGQEAKDKAKAELDAKRKEMEERLGEKVAKGEAQIAEMRKKALAELEAIAAPTAQAVIAEIFSGGQISKADIEKAVSEAKAKGGGYAV